MDVLGSTVWCGLTHSKWWTVMFAGRLYALQSQVQLYLEAVFTRGVGYSVGGKGTTALGTLFYARLGRLQGLRDCEDAQRLAYMVQLCGIRGLWERVPPLAVGTTRDLRECVSRVSMFLKLNGGMPHIIVRGGVSIVTFPKNTVCIAGAHSCEGLHHGAGKLYAVCHVSSGGDTIVTMKSHSSRHKSERLLTVRFDTDGKMCVYYRDR